MMSGWPHTVNDPALLTGPLGGVGAPGQKLGVSSSANARTGNASGQDGAEELETIGADGGLISASVRICLQVEPRGGWGCRTGFGGGL